VPLDLREALRLKRMRQQVARLRELVAAGGPRAEDYRKRLHELEADVLLYETADRS
jgi:hypothetical protein